MPNITKENVPKSVKLEVALFQKSVVKPVKNSCANCPISPKPLVIALIIAAPTIFTSCYIYILSYIYIKKCK